MSISDLMFRCGLSGAFVAMILYVLLGQITVRKLRKNQETKDNLGLEFASGWDILNVAQALSLPKFINQKLNQSPLSFLHANSDLLVKHTNKFDRVLARVFCFFYIVPILLIFLSALLD